MALPNIQSILQSKPMPLHISHFGSPWSSNLFAHQGNITSARSIGKSPSILIGFTLGNPPHPRDSDFIASGFVVVRTAHKELPRLVHANKNTVLRRPFQLQENAVSRIEINVGDFN
ncbi:MAG: hypothetical protein A3A96_02925 [Candidatus Zambryskibacteria bacterium RIFCSPLOWO2_01_FULL_39_39]|uniref:Uncharacterized protein n=1 Tax=Candidatus Zambryskibacteria bacterium RIFCSPLOWO2_01_FULL_39_39 TaxID=1802758 RepID=A0A1G2TWC0_9BACT|nr:MAG: hypothetical protein UT00_C0002G0037 [Parcubacteria group bacterium GW2011_GWA1_38_7]OHA86883.1 MAG: hypothetical protein A2644_00175 [Candidatus Zambryskibacteria bacterium RIFCSPHIGHO2_01_FULL_39_63]OHA94449.1 MAG: hypothetical protein A3B88_01995 [Candidatus Zambryskibacteria bacterium RIFCSPHIGHO2_02_FULL_39_19]OHA98980.1 MAG: hypothetical protein A3F20_00320 [Candidatus Zambryskibacteria bacterium RIFCSPHIGHO2_12_FULL_39_21]OHB01597.1 MAG: hypothetical protein A3A96_02925 [Candidat